MDACLFLKKYVQVPFKFTYSTGKSIYNDPQLFTCVSYRMSYMAWFFGNMSRSIACYNPPKSPPASSTTARPHIKLRLTSWVFPVGKKPDPLLLGEPKKSTEKHNSFVHFFLCILVVCVQRRRWPWPSPGSSLSQAPSLSITITTTISISIHPCILSCMHACIYCHWNSAMKPSSTFPLLQKHVRK